MCTREFVLLFFLSGAHLSSDPRLVFKVEGDSDRHHLGYVDRDYAVLYRVSADEDQLVVNCSQPETILQGYSVDCCEYGFIKIGNLTVGQSGHYRYESWSGGNITANDTVRLTVCEKYEREFIIFTFEDSGVLCRSDSALGNGTSIQVHRDSRYPTLVLDTNLSLEPLQEDLRGQLQVDLNASLVKYSELNEDHFSFFGFDFLCTIWKNAQCQTYIRTSMRALPKHVFGHEKEKLTLPCVLRRQMPGQVYWSTPTGDVRLSNNQKLQQEVMYMLNGSQTGDYSLIIPPMSQQHPGNYICKGLYRINNFFVFFCKKVSSLYVMFSHGDPVRLDVTADNQSFDFHTGMFQWYHQKVLQPQSLLLDSRNRFEAMPEDLRGRVTVERSNYSLLISNLTAEDIGVYMWRYTTYDHDLCFEREIHLVYRDPFGVDSVFYRAYGSVLGCVLLGVLAAVMWLKLRSRGGAFTPGGQEMEMQDIGDDVYDDVEEAEDSV